MKAIDVASDQANSPMPGPVIQTDASVQTHWAEICSTPGPTQSGQVIQRWGPFRQHYKTSEPIKTGEHEPLRISVQN